MTRSRARYVPGTDGKPIIGLSRNASDGRFYATHSKPRKWFGSDYHNAILRFREWESQGQALTIPHPPLMANADTIADRLTPEHLEILKSPFPVLVKSDVFWGYVRQAILEDPYYAAQRTGLALHRLQELPEPEVSLTLESLIERYANKTPRISPRYLHEVKIHWQEFTKSVGVLTVRELNADLITKYRDDVYLRGNGKSPCFVNARFTSIISIFRYARAEGRDVARISRAIELCSMLRKLKTAKLNPDEITPEDFGKLLAAADTKWKAILLYALNTAAYPVDIATVEKSHIDLDARTLNNNRTKTGVPRIAVLWDRTVEAIRDYMESDPHEHTKYLFANGNTPYDPDYPQAFGREYRALRKRAGVNAKFSAIRDAAQTAAIAGGADPIHVDMLLGHRTGIRDNYLKRKPTMVADACSAIEVAFFGKE